MEIKEYFKPKSVTQAYEVLQAGNNNRIIGGGAWVKISLKKVDTLISLDDLGLDYINEVDGYYEIGSMTSLRDLEVHAGIKEIGNGLLSKAISSVMGVTIRNIATIGGSVMGKFAFSDLLGVLLVLDAELVFYNAGVVSIEDFINMTKIPRDILVSIRIKKQAGKGYFKKVAITHLDFAILNLVVYKNDKFRIAIGSRPNIATLANRTQEYLNSLKNIEEVNLEEASKIALEEVKVGDNSRASKEYRGILMSTYLKRGIREVIK